MLLEVWMKTYSCGFYTYTAGKGEWRSVVSSVSVAGKGDGIVKLFQLDSGWITKKIKRSDRRSDPNLELSSRE